MLDRFMPIILKEINSIFPEDDTNNEVFVKSLEKYINSEYGELLIELKGSNDLIHMSKIIISGFSHDGFQHFRNYIISYEYIQLLLILSSMSFDFAKDKLEKNELIPKNITDELLEKLKFIEQNMQDDIRNSYAIKELISDIHLDLRYCSNQDVRMSLHLSDYLKYGK